MAPAHTHTPSMILDDDSALFTINPITREIEYNSEDPLIIMQDDTNSERLTFEIPKIIEGHDMSACLVQIHYINSGATGGQKTGIYEVSDLQVDPNDATMLRFTWLVSRNATKYDGSLRFSIRCLCTDSSISAEADPSDILNEDGTVAVGKITYEWSTFPCDDVIRIGSGIRNSTIFEEEEVNDALQSIKAGLVGTYRFINEHNGVEGSFLELTTSDDEVIVSDNLKCQVKGDQGDVGPAPTIKIGTVRATDVDNPVAKIEVANQNAGEVTLNFVLPQPARDYVTDINGNDMYFWSGTQAEYNTLTDEQKSKLFALITDDPGASDIETDIIAIKEDIEELKNAKQGGKVYVYGEYASAGTNTTAAISNAIGYLTIDSGTTYESETTVEQASNVDFYACKVNNIHIPFDGTEVIIFSSDYLASLNDLPDGIKSIDILARFNASTNKTKFITRAVIEAGASFSKITTYNTFLYVGSTLSACILSRKPWPNTDIVNELDKTYFTETMRDNVGEIPSKGDYLVDANGVIYKVSQDPTSYMETKILMISAGDIPKPKKYQHYVHFEVTDYAQPFFGTFTFKVTLSYISTRTSLLSFSNFVEDFWGVFATDDLLTKVPVSGTVIVTKEGASDKHSQILSHIKPCFNSSSEVKGVHLRVNNISDGTQIGDIGVMQNISTDILTNFECTSIEI